MVSRKIELQDDIKELYLKIEDARNVEENKRVSHKNIK